VRFRAAVFRGAANEIGNCCAFSGGGSYRLHCFSACHTPCNTDETEATWPQEPLFVIPLKVVSPNALEE